MKSWAFVTTPYAWCVPRSRSLLTTNSVWSTQIVVSGRSSSGVDASTKAGSMLPTAIACNAVATNTANVACVVNWRMASCAASVSDSTSGSGPSSRIEPASTKGTRCVTSACMHERGPHDPDDPAAPLLLLSQQLGQHGVIDGPLARHLRLHKAELVRAVAAAEEALGMHEDALAAVLFRADGDRLPLAHLARLRHHQVAGRVEHDDAVHPWQAGPTPGAGGLHVGRQVGGGKKAVGQDPVGRRRLEARVGRPRERR